jgi:small neutral amino acid transporter SnatA (MarC family)
VTAGLLVIAYLGALNVARARLGVPEAASSRARPGALAGGSLLVLGLIAALAGWSEPLLRALQITPETFRIAAGIAAMLAAAYVLIVPRPAAEPVPGGGWAALWPVCFPLLAGPEVMALAVATGSGEGVQATLAGTGAALVVLLLLGLLPRRPLADRVLLWLSRLLGLLLLLVGVWLAIDGIRDV